MTPLLSYIFLKEVLLTTINSKGIWVILNSLRLNCLVQDVLPLLEKARAANYAFASLYVYIHV